MHYNTREMQNSNGFASWNKLLVVLYCSEINLKKNKFQIYKNHAKIYFIKKGKVLYNFIFVFCVSSIVGISNSIFGQEKRAGIEWSK